MFSFFKKDRLPSPPVIDVEGTEPPTAHAAALGPTAATHPPSETSGTTRKGWIAKLRAGLGKTAIGLSSVFRGTRIDEALFEELENALLVADAGVSATQYLITELRREAKKNQATTPDQLKDLLIDGLTRLLLPMQKALQLSAARPTVVMVAGVNGAGKTTSIGKLTHRLADEGASVLLAAGDTFRAAAREQLAVWAKRTAVEVVSQDGGDPAAVSYDAVRAGIARRRDVVIIDTAGRLPTQLHLMEELKKIKRVVQRAGEASGLGSCPQEVLLVIDGNTGQNALTQVRAFDGALGLTGLIITKLDGTAKGGVLAAIAREHPVPVYFIGVGESLDELETFRAHEFAQALLQSL